MKEFEIYEDEIYNQLIQGKTRKAIGEDLGYSESTIRYFMVEIYKKNMVPDKISYIAKKQKIILLELLLNKGAHEAIRELKKQIEMSDRAYKPLKRPKKEINNCFNTSSQYSRMSASNQNKRII